MPLPLILHSSLITVLTIRSGLSSDLSLSLISPRSREPRKAFTPTRTASTCSPSSMEVSRFFTHLMQHLMVRSENLVLRPWSSTAPPSPRSQSRDKKVLVRLAFSKILSISTFRALSSCPPSSSAGTVWFSSSISKFFMIFLSVGSETAAAIGLSWNECIRVFRTYLQPLLLPGSGTLDADSCMSLMALEKITETFSESSYTSLSELPTSTVTSRSEVFLAKSRRTWQSCFIPSTDSERSSEAALFMLLDHVAAASSAGPRRAGEARNLREEVGVALSDDGVLGAAGAVPGLLADPGVLEAAATGSKVLNFASRVAFTGSGTDERYLQMPAPTF
mmetsp:Transcript_4886/g.17598  ORF Transcript_4886/g.17598 Transcript_4886/m.17598 type:complete len:334 (-) Transcript_4886:4079-5080(-)